MNPEAAIAETPRELAVPEPLIVSVMRTGKDRLWYQVEMCSGLVVRRVEHSTGFPDLDQHLDAHLGELGLAVSDCQTVSLMLDFSRACDPPVTN